MRKSKYDISPEILNRWSPRAMTGEPLTDDEFMPLFEAARWAASSYNDQPWRFIIARNQNKEDFEKFGRFLVEANSWAKKASVLVVLISHKNFELNNNPNSTHALTTGSALGNLAIEGAGRNLVVHGMAGFDYEAARTELHIPDDYSVECMVAIGKPDVEKVKEEQKEITDRKPLQDLIFEGEYGNAINQS